MVKHGMELLVSGPGVICEFQMLYPFQLFFYSYKAYTSFTVTSESRKQPLSFQVCNRLAVVVTDLCHQQLDHISAEVVTVREMEENSWLHAMPLLCTINRERYHQEFQRCCLILTTFFGFWLHNCNHLPQLCLYQTYCHCQIRPLYTLLSQEAPILYGLVVKIHTI
jgi:hypothetical protein